MSSRQITSADIVGLPAALAHSLNVRDYNASGSSLTTTGTIGSGATALTLAGALDFENDNGITIFGAGPLATVQSPTGITPITVGTAGATSLTYRVAPIDALGGVGPAAAGVTINTANASLSMNNYVGLSWTAPASGPAPKAYAIYKNGAFAGIASNVTNFNDQGTVRTRPSWCPATPPEAATSGALITSVVSGGGTTSLVLADPAGTAVSGATVQHDDTAALTSAFTAAMGTKRLAFNGGIYRISSEILITATGSLDIICPRNAILKSASFLSDQIFGMNDNGSRNRYSLSWVGGEFNNLDGLFGTAVASNSCIGTTRIGELIVEGVIFRGGASLAEASVSTDSGIAFVDSSNVSITNNTFLGQGDLGVYGSGGGLSTAEDDGGDIRITNNHFKWCGTAVAIKRQARRLIIAHNTMDENFAGVALLEAGSGASTIDPARQAIISANTIRKTVCAPICIHGSPDASKAYMIDNKIIDFGYLPDGVTAYNGSAAYGGTIAGIAIQGASQCRISGGEISLEEWANGDDGTANHKGVYVTDFVLNSVTHSVDALLIDNVDFANVNKGIFEDSGTANGPTFALGCVFRNVGTKTTFVHASSISEEFDIANGIRGTVGSAEVYRFSSAGIFATRFRTFLDSVGYTKINRTSATLDFASVSANSTKDLTVAISGMTVANGFAKVTPQASNLLPTGISYFAWVSAANTVTVRAINSTTGAIVVPSGSFVVNGTMVS